MKTIYSISKKAGLLLSFLLLAVSLMAQNSIHVKGVVKDPVGEAIIGASVVVKGVRCSSPQAKKPIPTKV